VDFNDRIIRPIVTQQTPRSRCLIEGCPCRDPRIVSMRRARFYAHLAQVTGETGLRVIHPEPGWELPHSV
jgi:hypothetical protein